MTYIHPNTPPKLVKAFRAADEKYHRLADELGVNVAHVYNLIKHGREPKAPEIRVKLFLHSSPRKKRRARIPRTKMQIAIDTMKVKTRRALNAHLKTKANPATPAKTDRSSSARNKSTH